MAESVTGMDGPDTDSLACEVGAPNESVGTGSSSRMVQVVLDTGPSTPFTGEESATTIVSSSSSSGSFTTSMVTGFDVSPGVKVSGMLFDSVKSSGLMAVPVVTP